MSYKVDISKMRICDARWSSVLKRIINNNGCYGIECSQCPMSYENHIYNIYCSNKGGFAEGSDWIGSDKIIGSAKWLYDYIKGIRSIDVNDI